MAGSGDLSGEGGEEGGGGEVGRGGGGGVLCLQRVRKAGQLRCRTPELPQRQRAQRSDHGVPVPFSS